MKHINIFTVTLVLVFLAGCMENNDSIKSTDNEIFKQKTETRCLDGVTYIIHSEVSGTQGFGYMSVKFNTDSKIIPCTED
jgi:hypothetical protein